MEVPNHEGRPYIVVITTCASDLIGDNFKAVIEETKAKGDVDCDIVYTTGDFV